MSRFISKPFVALLAIVMVASTAALVGGTAQAGRTTVMAQTAATGTAKPVARNDLGTLTSKVRGTTGNDRRVTGTFVPLDFKRKNGKVKVRGLIQGVVHNADGSTSTFSAMRTMRVARINGAPATAAGVAERGAACDVLNLVLGPLDLDVLGLKVNLSRVVLDIVAESGAGNLLGNLLCAVAGLLDGGLDGVLGRLTRLLDRILGALRLGV